MILRVMVRARVRYTVMLDLAMIDINNALQEDETTNILEGRWVRLPYMVVKGLEGWWVGLKEYVCFEYGRNLAAVRVVGGPMNTGALKEGRWVGLDIR